MMRVKMMMIFAAGKRRCGDPDRGGRFVRHHILYVYQIFLSLSLTPIKRLKVRRLFVDAAFALRAFNVYQPHAKKSALLVVVFKCVYLKSFKRIDFGTHS